MLSFFQLYEMLLENKIQHPELSTSNDHYEDIKSLLTGQPKEINVRFALHCAEDEFNNNKLVTSRYCINLVKQWLNSTDEERNSWKDELKDAADDREIGPAARAAANAAYSDVDIYAKAARAALYAANDAAYAVARKATPNDENEEDVYDSVYTSVYNKKMNEYKAFANSLRSTVPNFNNPLYTTKAFDPQNPDSIYVFIDELQDHGIDIIIQDGQSFKLNNPQLTITGKTPTELYNKIANDSKAVTWLMSLANNLSTRPE